MKKAAPEKESGLKVMHGHSIKTTDTRAGAPVAHARRRMYRDHVAANSATGFGSPNKLAHKRPSNPRADAFFVSVSSSYGGCARENFGSAGCQLSRSTNLRTVATQSCLVAGSGGSTLKVGAMPMNRIRTIRAAAHRRMAIAALHADTSLKTRLTRYQQHMTKARALEGGAA